MKIIFFYFLVIFSSFYLSADEVKILEDIPGYGLEITNHSKVNVHYIGKFENNIEFDNSYKRNQTFQFQIGTRQVILGWETGLLGMKEGGKRKIFIPFELAYGENGVGDLIPPKSNLIFEIEIIKVIPPKYDEIDSYQLKLAITDDRFTIVDIRNLNEIKNTGLIPTSILLTAFDNQGNFMPDFFKKYQEKIKPGSRVILVSDKGIISSILANGFVEKLDQKNIYNLRDGIEGLKNIGFNFEKY